MKSNKNDKTAPKKPLKKRSKTAWKTRIKKACIEAGTYKPYFDEMIISLAAVLEKRDEAEIGYVDSGNAPVVEHTNQGGATNLVKNPYLIVWMDLNAQALSYWRDLGLTPAGLKKLGENTLTVKTSALEEALSKIT